MTGNVTTNHIRQEKAALPHVATVIYASGKTCHSHNYQKLRFPKAINSFVKMLCNEWFQKLTPCSFDLKTNKIKKSIGITSINGKDVFDVAAAN
jgi:hypothetical protein